jgi:hypothetical protein
VNIYRFRNPKYIGDLWFGMYGTTEQSRERRVILHGSNLSASADVDCFYCEEDPYVCFDER